MHLIPGGHGNDATHGRPAATTQDIKVTRAVADWVVVMRSGKFVGQGQGNNVFCPPNQPHKGARLASVPNRALGELDHFNAKHMAKEP